jgi:hypothetical protein
MTFLEFAFRMFPYWMLGAFTFYSVWNSEYRDMLAVNKRSVIKFSLFMLLVTCYRIWRIKSMVSSGVDTSSLAPVKNIPIFGTLFVPWEDLCFCLPLVFIRRLIGTDKWWKKSIHWILVVLTMISFGSGHLYQGVAQSVFLSFYIPFMTNFGDKKGFGTLMTNHVLYDFSTMMAIRIALG